MRDMTMRLNISALVLTLCNGKSIHNDSTAELAVGLTIASLRGFARFVFADQDKSEWVSKTFTNQLMIAKIGIVGFGSIGYHNCQNVGWLCS